MADIKVSALSAASALAGTEVLPIVQSAATVKVTPAQIATYVSGALTASTAVPLITPSSVWASRGSGTFTGQLIRITDVGPANVGTLFVWDNTASVWKLTAPCQIIFDTTVATASALNTSEQIVKQNTIPIGLLSAGRLFVLRIVWGKDGTTDTATPTLRIGSAGTTGDGQIMTFATLISAANRQSNTETWLYPSTVTNLVLGNTIAHQGFASNSAGTTSPAPINFTIADHTANAIIISANTTMSGSTNHGQVARMIVELLP